MSNHSGAQNAQRENIERTYDQFHRIAERGVDKTSQRFSQPMRNLFCREGQHSGERDNGEEIEGENPRGAPFLLASNDSDGYKNEQYIDPG